ncbi:MAG: hypothetical protein M3Y13_02775 [Armatimonadota bacterium]|nr:hypothetical protein [Armatimonadota bacterium]
MTHKRPACQAFRLTVVMAAEKQRNQKTPDCQIPDPLPHTPRIRQRPPRRMENTARPDWNSMLGAGFTANARCTVDGTARTDRSLATPGSPSTATGATAGVSAFPHSPQHFLSSGLSALHLAQIITAAFD